MAVEAWRLRSSRMVGFGRRDEGGRHVAHARKRRAIATSVQAPRPAREPQTGEVK